MKGVLFGSSMWNVVLMVEKCFFSGVNKLFPVLCINLPVNCLIFDSAGDRKFMKYTDQYIACHLSVSERILLYLGEEAFLSPVS